MRNALLLMGCLALSCLGCGGSARLAPVSGRVTLNGAPLPNAKVIFQPIPKGGIESGPASQGETNANGEYTLALIGKNKSGAVIGEHRVSISALQGTAPTSADDNPKPRKDLVPEQYNGDKTTLKFEVPPSGSKEADFKLTAHKGGS
jgi:hypothetical protein